MNDEQPKSQHFEFSFRRSDILGILLLFTAAICLLPLRISSSYSKLEILTKLLFCHEFVLYDFNDALVCPTMMMIT